MDWYVYNGSGRLALRLMADPPRFIFASLEVTTMAMAKNSIALNAEIVDNFKAFQNQLSGLLPEHEGKVCLLRHGQNHRNVCPA